MKTACKKPGLSLVEVLITIVIISVAVIGAAGYRYYCVLDARKADMQITGAKFASLLLEGWKGTGARADYDPTACYFGPELTITKSGIFEFGPDNTIIYLSPAVAEGFWPVGIYTAALNDVGYYAMLSYKDETADRPRVLNVCVVWLQKGAGTVRLTTYAGY